MFLGQNQETQTIDNFTTLQWATQHEGSKFLYSSGQAKSAILTNVGDLMVLVYAGAYLAGNNLLLLPFFVSLLYIPRRWVQMKYFTWYAELLPE